MSPRNFLSSFESNGLSVQEKGFKIDFQDGNCGGHIGFLITILARSFLPSFKLNSSLIQETNFKIFF